MDAIDTDDASASIGPHSRGIVENDRIYVLRQGPVDPGTGGIESEVIAATPEDGHS